eukprot:15254986-Alexandrium_andersonii.AAC.1
MSMCTSRLGGHAHEQNRRPRLGGPGPQGSGRASARCRVPASTAVRTRPAKHLQPFPTLWG